MKSVRKLSLRREAMTELSAADLRYVAGAGTVELRCVIEWESPALTQGISCVDCPSIPLTGCTILNTDTLVCPSDIC